MNFVRSLTPIALVAALSGAAVGQITQPPPPPTPAEPEYTAPERARPAQPVQPQQQRPRNVPKRPTAPDQLPDIEVPPIQGAADDVQALLTRPPLGMHYAALKINPAVSENDREAIESVLLARRLQAETYAIVNLETMLSVQDGLLDGMTIQQPELMKQISDQVLPLILRPTPTMALLEKDAISPVAAGFNNVILQQYNTDLGTAMEEVEPEDSMSAFVRELLRVEMAETENAFDMLCYEATTRLASIIGKMDIEQGLVNRVMKAQSEATDDRAQQMAFARRLKQAWRPLSLEQKQEILRQTIATRGDDRAKSPSVSIPLGYDGKVYVDPEG